MNLTKTAIARPIAVFMVVMALVLLGFMSYRSMRLEEYPELAFGTLSITTVYPGAGPEEVNNVITRKIEEAVSGVSGIRSIISTSDEGVSNITVQFDFSVNMSDAMNEVRAKIDTVIKDLPTDAERPIVTKFDFGAMPILTLALNSDRLDAQQLRDLADNEIKERISQIEGVGQVSVQGGSIREIQIRLKRDQMLRYGIGILDVQRALANGSVNIPSGQLTNGRSETTVRVLGEAKTPDDLANIAIELRDNSNPNGDSSTVRLGQVAEIVDTVAKKTSISRLNGREAVILSVIKTRDGNAVEIASKVLGGSPSLVDQLNKDYGIDVAVPQNSSVRIKESLLDLQIALIFGIILVIAVIYMFLHNFRGTMIVAIAIPVCIAVTIIAMKGLGFSINNMTMLALSLAVGVLVDDAIVVIENTYRHLTHGETPAVAALNGRAEIGLAALAITAADVVVFVPIGNMGGISGQFFRPLGLSYAACVIVSLLVSFTVTPMLAARWYKEGEDWEHPKGRFAGWFNRNFDRLARGYGNSLAKALDNRWMVVGMGFAILFSLFMFIAGSFIPVVNNNWSEAYKAAIMLPIGAKLLPMFGMIGVIILAINAVRGKFHFKTVTRLAMLLALLPVGSVCGMLYKNAYKNADVFTFSFVPPTDTGQVSVSVEMPPGTSIEETESVIKTIEDRVKGMPEVEYVLSSVGSVSGGFQAGSSGANIGTVNLYLYEKAALLDHLSPNKPAHLRTKPDTILSGEVLEKVSNIPGARIIVRNPSNFSGAGAPIQMGISSNNRELAIETANRIRLGLQKGAVTGVVTPDISTKPGKPEIQAIPRTDRLSLDGISTLTLGLAMRTMYQGDNNTKFRQQGNEYDIRVQMDESDRNDPELLQHIPITFVRGRPIFLNDVADIHSASGIDRIRRENQREQVLVSADLLPSKANGTAQEEITDWIKKENLIPDGVQYRELGQTETQNREMGYILGAIMLGLVLVYIVLAILFENLLYPLVIQLAQPQAMVGALMAVILADRNMSVIGMIGIITLIGLVGKNGILLVDYTNTLRERGHDRRTALVEAGMTRLRPIMMTTIALLVGLMPVALAIGRGSEFRDTIGITIIGGMVLSTMLTLLVIPCSYSIFDDLLLGIQKPKSFKLFHKIAAKLRKKDA